MIQRTALRVAALILASPLGWFGVACSVDVPDAGLSGQFACRGPGECIDGFACVLGRCVNTNSPSPVDVGGGDACARVCEQNGWECGLVPDGCGQLRSCGTCSGAQSCGAQQVGQCGDGPRLGTVGNPAASCRELQLVDGATMDGIYTLRMSGADAVELFCDMTTYGGGWTLVGKVSGRHNMYDEWLRRPVKTEALRISSIEANTYACIDAVELAVLRAQEIRLSNADRTRFVSWTLPAGRTVSDFWRHAAGYDAIATDVAQSTETVVHDDRGTEMRCQQNRRGILALDVHGGSYPATSMGRDGTTTAGDLCMAVGVQVNTDVHGFSQNGNGFDAPGLDGQWPNPNFNIDPMLSVWLR